MAIAGKGTAVLPSLRVDLNHRAVLFAVGEQHEPMWLLAAIKPA
ncbi:MAG: hypothetical protein ABIZ05_16550 [Pseudonocardiaceae bacterium]